MPTDTASLRTLLEGRLQDDGSLTLDDGLGEEVEQLLVLLNAETLALTGAVLTPPRGEPAPGATRIEGTATLWGAQGTPLVITLEPGPGGAARMSLRGTPPSLTLPDLGRHLLPLAPGAAGGTEALAFAPGDVRAAVPDGTLVVRGTLAQAWSPLGLERVALEGVALGVAVISDPDWGESRRVLLDATLRLDQRRIPVELEVPLGTGTWTLGIVPPGVQVNLLQDLAQLMGGADFAAALPGQLVSMTELTLRTLRIQFDPAGPAWHAVDLGIETANPWPIASGIRIDGVGLRLNVRHGTPRPVVTGAVSGALTLGSMTFAATVPIPLSGMLRLAGASRQPFGGFGELAALADAEWAASLPRGVAALGALEIHQVWLDYDLTAGRVASLGIDIGSVNRWAVIPDWLELENLRFRVDASRGGSGWAITGRAGGTLIAAGIRVSAEVRGGGGEWWLGLTEPLLLPSVGDIAALIGGRDAAKVLPPGVDAGLGALTVHRADITFGGADRGVRAVNVGFRTTNPWRFWDPYFILTSLDVSVAVEFAEGTGTEPGKRTLDAAITGALRVGSVDIFLSATHPRDATGWQLEGRTGPEQEIPVGHLLDWVAAKFDVTVPESLRSFELHNIHVSFNTDTRAFRFDCGGSFVLLGRTVDLELHLGVDPPPQAPALPAAGAATEPATVPATTGTTPAAAAGFKLKAQGTLTIGGSQFKLTFEMGAGSTRFTAAWTAVTDPATGKLGALEFEDIAELFGFELPEVPEGLRLSLVEASFTYDFSRKQLALTATSLHYGAALFVADASGEKTRYLFALEIQAGIGLANLPVVGQAIPRELAFSIDTIALWLASAPVSAADTGSLSELIPEGSVQVPAAGLGQGPTLSLGLRLGEATHTLTLGTAAPQPALQSGTSPALPTSTASTPTSATATATASTRVPATGAESSAAPPAVTPAQAAAPQDGTSWLNLQKTVGPLSLERIGFRYRAGRVTVLLDGGLSIAGFSFSLYGLQVSSAIKPPLNLSLGLDGLGLEVARGPLLISGAFLRTDAPGMDWKYAGLVNVRMQQFGLGAVGVYGSTGGRPSLFVFGTLDAPLGGHPALFVMGLSGGFGFNSRVRLPGPDQVQDFPFVAGLSAPPAPPGTRRDPLEVLRVLEGTSTTRPGPAWVTADPGQVWLAAGIQFTSFKLVSTRALVLANLGERDISFALLGISGMQLPPESPTVFARVELQLAAVFKPMEGFLGVSAVLSRNSYLLHPSCRLTGGFGFFLWFAGEHAGDFVLSVGGYHPSFTVPAHYPRLERLGFSWQVSTAVTLKGGAYFALTPSCVMAGIGLEATFSTGNLKAWFRASADFLAQWHPFHFDARVGVSVGVSYRLEMLFTTVTLSVEIGAELHVWGPPTGGEVYVDWYVISFTIPFGDRPDARQERLEWTEFSRLLPPPDARLSLSLDGVQGGHGGEQLARPDDVSFTTRSAIPATELVLATPAGNAVHQRTDALSIRPMRRTGVAAPQTLTVTRDGTVIDLKADGWTVETETQNHPEALWGAPLPAASAPAPSAVLLRGQLAGLRVRAPRARAGATPGPIDVERDLSYAPVAHAAPLPLVPGAQAGGPAPVADAGTVDAIAAGADTDAARAARDEVVAALAALGAAPATAGSLAGVARDAGFLYLDAPLRTA